MVVIIQVDVVGPRAPCRVSLGVFVLMNVEDCKLFWAITVADTAVLEFIHCLQLGQQSG
jgi:hypothetical protein